MIEFELFSIRFVNILIDLCSVCEKLQATRAKVAPANLIYGSHFSVTEATYEMSQNIVNFVEFTKNIYKN